MKDRFNLPLFLALWIWLFGLVLVTTGAYSPISTESESEPEPLAIVEDQPEEKTSPELPVLFTNEEVEMMAKVLYAEARGVKSEMEQAAVVWVILNRLDKGDWGSTIEDVVTYPNAVAYYQSTPVDQGMVNIVNSVVTTYTQEKVGLYSGGRVIPKEYLYFVGDGERNHFTAEWGSTEFWDWSLPNPYSS